MLKRALVATALIPFTLATEASAQFPDLNIKIDATPPPAQAEPEPAPAKAEGPQITAKLEGAMITLGDGRVLELKEQRGQMIIYPELEVKAPEGASVELWYDKRRVYEGEIPFVFKDTKPDQYLKMIVKEPAGTWSVKFMPKKQHRTTILLAGGAAAPASAGGGGGCKKTLLAKGHHSMHLDNCKGVDDACAVAVLEAGHHPQHLSNCTPGLAPRCVQTLLKKQHHPQHLSDCKGVDDTCAVALLERGDHPQNLSDCGGD